MSPDGRFMVLENKVVPVDGSDAFDLVEMKALRAIYAPGMKKAAFYADSAIWTVPVSPETGRSNGQPEKLLSGGYIYQYPVSWSPDGEKIAFTQDGQNHHRGCMDPFPFRKETFTCYRFPRVRTFPCLVT